MDESTEFEERAARFRDAVSRIEQEVAKVIVGQRQLVRDVVTGLFTGGHVLMEGVPGIGKTLLVHTLADCIDCGFSRIQFTPDLMPSDIIGTRIVVEDEHGHKQFSFQRGPVFTQVLLADEINRATPKTQSALLEAMQEKQVTVSGDSLKLDRPFFVIATQNPLEMEGTYPLPEAQLDRFIFKLNVPYPLEEDLIEVARRTTRREMPTAENVVNAAEINDLVLTVRDVPVAEHVERFAVRILLATHPENAEAPDSVRRYVKYGASPRGLQAAILGGKVRALLDGRFHLAEEDLRDVAKQALRHRMLLNFEGEAEGIAPDQLIDAVIESAAAPVA